MGNLATMKNIDERLEGLLVQAGIIEPEQLKAMASFGAWEAIRKIEPSIGYNELIALEGATQNMTVDELPEDVKKYIQKIVDSMVKK